MLPWLSEIPRLIGEYLVLSTAVFVATLLITFAVSVAILIHLPANYLRSLDVDSMPVAGPGILFRLGFVVKNLFGAILLVVGIILSVPGLPGQGLLTVLAAVLLLDFPGKRKLLYGILRRPRLLGTVNRLRQRFLRAPLVVD